MNIIFPLREEEIRRRLWELRHTPFGLTRAGLANVVPYDGERNELVNRGIEKFKRHLKVLPVCSVDTEGRVEAQQIPYEDTAKRAPQFPYLIITNAHADVIIVRIAEPHVIPEDIRQILSTVAVFLGSGVRKDMEKLRAFGEEESGAAGPADLMDAIVWATQEHLFIHPMASGETVSSESAARRPADFWDLMPGEEEDQDMMEYGHYELVRAKRREKRPIGGQGDGGICGSMDLGEWEDAAEEPESEGQALERVGLGDQRQLDNAGGWLEAENHGGWEDYIEDLQPEWRTHEQFVPGLQLPEGFEPEEPVASGPDPLGQLVNHEGRPGAERLYCKKDLTRSSLPPEKQQFVPAHYRPDDLFSLKKLAKWVYRHSARARGRDRGPSHRRCKR